MGEGWDGWWLESWPPKGYVHDEGPEYVNATSFGKRVFTDVIKDLEMKRSS